MSFRIQIASAPDRERAFAEIFVEGKFVALVAHAEEGQSGRLELELPGPGVVEELVLRRVDLDTFLRAVSQARAELTASG